jgi:hypothetical protein
VVQKYCLERPLEPLANMSTVSLQIQKITHWKNNPLKEPKGLTLHAFKRNQSQFLYANAKNTFYSCQIPKPMGSTAFNTSQNFGIRWSRLNRTFSIFLICQGAVQSSHGIPWHPLQTLHAPKPGKNWSTVANPHLSRCNWYSRNITEYLHWSIHYETHERFATPGEGPSPDRTKSVRKDAVPETGQWAKQMLNASCNLFSLSQCLHLWLNSLRILPYDFKCKSSIQAQAETDRGGLTNIHDADRYLKHLKELCMIPSCGCSCCSGIPNIFK